MKGKISFISLALSSIYLSSCSDSIVETISDPIENVLPNLWLSIAQLGAFGITVFIFFKFFYKPLKEKINKRNEKIRQDLEDAKNLKQSAQEENEIASMNIKDSRSQASSIIKKAQDNAKIEAKRIIEEANKQIEINKNSAHNEIEKEKEMMEKEIKDKIINLSFDLSKEILSREVSKDDNEKIVDDFISNIEDK